MIGFMSKFNIKEPQVLIISSNERNQWFACKNCGFIGNLILWMTMAIIYQNEVSHFLRTLIMKLKNRFDN
jgi:hypothetical protein